MQSQLVSHVPDHGQFNSLKARSHKAMLLPFMNRTMAALRLGLNKWRMLYCLKPTIL